MTTPAYIHLSPGVTTPIDIAQLIAFHGGKLNIGMQPNIPVPAPLSETSVVPGVPSAADRLNARMETLEKAVFVTKLHEATDKEIRERVAAVSKNLEAHVVNAMEQLEQSVAVTKNLTAEVGRLRQELAAAHKKLEEVQRPIIQYASEF